MYVPICIDVEQNTCQQAYLRTYTQAYYSHTKPAIRITDTYTHIHDISHHILPVQQQSHFLISVVWVHVQTSIDDI